MKHSLLSRLRRNGLFYIVGALFLLLGVPLYQAFILAPRGYGDALTAVGAGRIAPYLLWVANYPLQFIVYRVLLIAAFAFMLTMPFSLFRIIVAQELMEQQEREEEAAQQTAENSEADELLVTEDAAKMDDEEPTEEEEEGTNDATGGMPPYAWRGKGFAVIAAWSGLFGLLTYILGSIISTLYLTIASSGFTLRTALPGNIAFLLSNFSILTNTVGVGLLALSTLFFGAMIARGGGNLWPTTWILFGYTALAVAALLSGSAVGVASAPSIGQTPLTTPAILLFALWVLWLGSMLVRLKAE